MAKRQNKAEQAAGSNEGDAKFLDVPVSQLLSLDTKKLKRVFAPLVCGSASSAKAGVPVNFSKNHPLCHYGKSFPGLCDPATPDPGQVNVKLVNNPHYGQHIRFHLSDKKKASVYGAELVGVQIGQGIIDCLPMCCSDSLKETCQSIFGKCLQGVRFDRGFLACCPSLCASERRWMLRCFFKIFAGLVRWMRDLRAAL